MRKKREVVFVELKSGLGAGQAGTHMGMEAIKHAARYAGNHFLDQNSNTTISIKPPPYNPSMMEGHKNFKNGKTIVDFIQKSSVQIEQELDRGKFPFIISGDHSNALSTMNACSKAIKGKRLGVVWIDAHADLNTPYTSNSGNVHGMPLAAALGFSSSEYTESSMSKLGSPTQSDVASWEELKSYSGLSPKIQPENIVFLGTRDIDSGEVAVMEKFNIKEFKVSEFVSEGTMSILQKCDEYLSDCDAIYVSFDIDSLEKGIVPGTGTPVEEGFSSLQAKAILRHFWESPKLMAMEFTEVNPLIDIRNQTAKIAAKLLSDLMS